ncbi:MAG: hypothetical protein B0D91_09040 [Oceanospirillales bacterium LUC14_002_19_P2]|nr:MAG: hypothetical protein B0D91_09040 [Oceanospirillales bacterium LUC14_002_19_P2]
MKRILLSILMLLTIPAWGAAVCEQDATGQSVCLDKPARRIVSLAPNITELLFAAGAGTHIAGVDSYSTYPAAANEITTIGGFPNISVEALLALQPDLVVVWAGVTSPQLSEKIESLGIRVFHLGQATIPDVATSIRTLGRLAGTATVANRNADAFLARYETLHDRYADRTPVSVFFEIWHAPLRTVGGRHLTSQAIALCGGKNVFADQKVNVPAVGIESLLARNPDAIVSTDRVGNDQDIYQRWQKLTVLEAVREQQLITLPDKLISLPTPRMLDGAEMLCEQLQAIRDNHQPPKQLIAGHTE